MKNLDKIEGIYHAAIDLPDEERPAFLREVCGDDFDLRNEVESLLGFDAKALSFIESPPDDLAAALLADQSGHDILGKRIDRYHIISHLGSGGMGDVFLAEDTKLFRKVALKLIPAQFALNSERKSRFEREARTVSSLNHRNIITIYEIQEIDGVSFMATEFVDGETLSERIAAGPIAWQDAAAIASQIASALDAAHSVGIIHRDIKPANIMIRRDDEVKVLDFGLAKLIAPSAESGSYDTRDHNAQNRVMGTIHYMSPEQALGDELDERTDVFSLGVVLYEMLTGKRPFVGPSDAAVYNAIINANPRPIHDDSPDVPEEFEEIVSLAMTKERDHRRSSAGDLRDTLLNLVSGQHLGLPRRASSVRSAPRKLLPIIAAAALIAVLFVGFGSMYLNRQAAVVQKDTSGNFKFTQLTSQGGEELFPSISADSQSFIFTSRESGNWDIYFQRLGDANPTNLTKDSLANDTQGVFSRDGNSIAFRSERDGGGIFVMDAAGRSVRRISKLGYHPAWSPDGNEIAYGIDDFEEPGSRTITPSELWRINIVTGERHLVTRSDAVQPSWSPNGLRIAFWGINAAGQRDVYTVSATGDVVVPVTNDGATDWNPVWAADGKSLYFLSDRDGSMNLWRVGIDELSGNTSGEPEPIRIPAKYSKFLRFSPDEKSFSYVQTTNYSNLFRIAFAPRTETAGKLPVEITRGSKVSTNPDISSDGQSLVFDSIGDKQEDIFVSASDGSSMRQITNDVYKDRAPRWSPDGKRISVFSDASGKYECWTMLADGSERQQISSFPKGQWSQIAIWSPDGRRLLCNTSYGYPTIYDLESREATQILTPPDADGETKHRFLALSWSPNGDKLLGHRLDFDGTEPTIELYDLTTSRSEPVADFGYRVAWLADSRRCIFTYRDKLFLADTVTKEVREIFSITPYRFQSISISSDDRLIYYSMQKSESDIWMAIKE